MSKERSDDAKCPLDRMVMPLPCPFCGSTLITTHEGSTFRWVLAE